MRDMIQQRLAYLLRGACVKERALASPHPHPTATLGLSSSRKLSQMLGDHGGKFNGSWMTSK